MPRISSDILDCATYLYQSKQDAIVGEGSGGSGFLFPLSYSEDCSVEGIHVYAVTNAHLVCLTPQFPVIRLRRLSGEPVIIDPRDTGDTWIRHPNGDDLAICPLRLDPSDTFRLITPPWHLRPRPEEPGVDVWGETLGREVMMVGRFFMYGKETNIPVLRFGNVSALPVEPIEHPVFGIKQESYLVEMHSLSGFSGSPVFVLPDPWKQMQVDPAKEKFVQWKLSLESPFGPKPIMSVRDMTLLGVDWCHIDAKLQRVTDKRRYPVDEDLYVPANSGMAGVVPWWKLWGLFDDPDIKRTRKEIEDRAEQRAGDGSVTPD